jgi:hypothetical protein
VPKFIVTFSNNTILHYQLDMSVLAIHHWMKEIVRYDKSDLCDINYKPSLGNKEIILDKIQELYRMADILNIVYPGSITKEEFFKGNDQEALNKMHVHFPNIHHDELLKDVDYYASRYNSLIHSLEKEFLPRSATRFRVSFDIHKSPKGFTSCVLDKEDYKKFEVFHEFGSLVLNYPHVGRHAQELFNGRDLTCPKHQYVPQSAVSGSCAMLFGIPKIKEHEKEKYLDQWKQFYTDRGGKDFFGCDIDDPEIRFGSIKIGQLCYSSIRGESININDLTGMLKIRKELLTNDIESFIIVE